jgi:hypothetical protein
MVIAVVDSGSRLVAFSRMDNAQLGSIDIAMGKGDDRQQPAPSDQGIAERDRAGRRGS